MNDDRRCVDVVVVVVVVVVVAKYVSRRLNRGGDIEPARRCDILYIVWKLSQEVQTLQDPEIITGSGGCLGRTLPPTLG